MSVVSTEKIRIDGREVKIAYRVKADGVFRVTLPPTMAETLGTPEVEAPTLKEARANFRKALQSYADARTTKKRVIVYRVRVDAQIEGGIDECVVAHNCPEPPRKVLLNRRDSGFEHGLLVAVWANVYDEATIKLPSGGMRYTYDEVGSALPESIKAESSFGQRLGGQHREKCQMDWSPKREQFFCNIAALMERLALKLNDITADTEQFATFAEVASAGLLTGGKTPEEQEGRKREPR